MEETVQHAYKTGTLSYTKRSLLKLFSWLMWGDFCYSMESTVDPSVLPFMLKGMGAADSLISILTVTLPNVINWLLNPIISTASDRYRSRRGRRIPFLAIATPFIAVTVAATGFAPQIGQYLHKALGISPMVPVALVFLSALTVLYRIASMFVGTTFYYLFNDVVPEEVMGRFTTGFRIFGTIANVVFLWFGYKYVKTHPQYLCLAAAAIYLVGFGMMCVKVKEGKYPPPPTTMRTANPFKILFTYFNECFFHRIYIYYFLAYTFVGLFYGASSFTPLMANLSMHLDTAVMGHIMGWTNWISLAPILYGGFLMDRYHPMRIWFVAIGTLVLLYPGIAAWAFIQKTGNFVPFFWCQNVISNVCQGLAQTAIWPLGMLLVPKHQYGQFSSAAAMVGALFAAIGGLIVGPWLGHMAVIYHGDPFHYRWALVWGPTMCAISLVFMALTFREWKKLGGDKGYVAPVAPSCEVTNEAPVGVEV